MAGEGLSLIAQLFRLIARGTMIWLWNDEIAMILMQRENTGMNNN